MLLSENDIRLLEKSTRCRDEFVRYDKHGYAMLRNRKGHCVFYDCERQRCKAYRFRPLGCRIYPVVFSEEKGVVMDRLCPMGSTVSKSELKRKGKKVIALLTKIDSEARNRSSSGLS